LKAELDLLRHWTKKFTPTKCSGCFIRTAEVYISKKDYSNPSLRRWNNLLSLRMIKSLCLVIA